MTNLERMAAQIAEEMNGGEFSDNKWYSGTHRTSWMSAVKPFHDEIDRLTAEVERLTLNGIHTRSDECQRPLCVARRENARLREALTASERAISEYYRYWTGGETRGSYDGKPERQGLWEAQRKARAALEGK